MRHNRQNTNVQLQESPFMPPVYDQGSLGSCTPNAVAAAIQFRRASDGKRNVTPSRLFLYFNGRRPFRTQNEDSGSVTSVVLAQVSKVGWVPENRWNYQQGFTQRPSKAAYKVARRNRGVQYSAVSQTEQGLENSISSGKPVIVTFRLPYDFYGKEPIQRPGNPKEMPEAYHTVLVTGFDDINKEFTIRNSWGTSWGESGYRRMSYDFLLDSRIAFDFQRLDKA